MHIVATLDWISLSVHAHRDWHILLPFGISICLDTINTCQQPVERRFAAGRSFVKMHGLHNHCVIVDGRDIPFKPTRAEAAHICDVATGIGADQLMIIEKPSFTGAHDGACAYLRIINVDGLEAQACGNATRCVAWLLLEETGADQLVLESAGGLLVCKRRGHQSVSVNMGKILSAWHDIPMARACDTLHVPVGNGPLQDPLALNIGNPHVVFFVDDLSSVDMQRYAPAIQNHPLFPEQVNVGAAEVVSDGHIRLSVYERPGILTRACGSGACVAARALQLRGLTTRNRIQVDMAGGTLDIELCQDGSAIMSGAVEYCFSGTLATPAGVTC